jgi:hypothetical protein
MPENPERSVDLENELMWKTPGNPMETPCLIPANTKRVMGLRVMLTTGVDDRSAKYRICSAVFSVNPCKNSKGSECTRIDEADNG